MRAAPPGATPVTPDAAALRLWRHGAVRGLRKAQAFCGLSMRELKSLVDAGALECFPLGDRGDLMFPRRALVALLARLQREAGAGART